MADAENTQATLDTAPVPEGMAGQLRSTFDGLPAPQRAVIGLVGIAALIVIGSLIVKQAAALDMRPVARGLLPEDQKTVVEALSAKNIPYELDEGTVRVPTDSIHEARMELAAATMPSGKVVGFELFDETELGRSSFAEKVNYHRALEGELARTIRNIRSVERARVHLVMPERRLFEEDEVEPSASVVLTLKGGAPLSRMQVQAIRQLVAGAVERLKSGKVSVVDQSGAMLARPESDDWVNDESLEYQAKYERNLERRVVALLEPVIGRGKVRSQVAAELDFSRIVQTEEKFDPESQVIRSEREKAEKSSSEQRTAAGIPGSGSNLPARQAGGTQNAPQGKEGSSDFSDHIKNYEIDKQVIRTETPHVRIKRLSIAVVVDAGEGDSAVGEAQIAQYTRLVRKAVGIDPERGDEIEVIAMPFTALAELDTRAADIAPGVGSLVDDPILRYGALGVIVLISLAIAFAFWRRRRASQRLIEEAEATRLRKAQDEANLLALQHGDAFAEEIQAKIKVLRNKAAFQGETDIRRTAAVIRDWMLTSPSPTPGGEP